ncbi:uncharacterized protein [Dermacentor andersoni]|uniref:uncharacterized protein n=1 Tax=Dermacentor andersoni TaxID=34620 RepID=UPI002155D508|nr:uncharacterized protein LOC126522389 [Dermacentor andersoni]
MPRTKKPKPRQSSLLPGCALGAEQIRYLECMVSELECTVESCLEATQGIADRICRNVDMWYDGIIRTVPEEILNRPYREVWDSVPVAAVPDFTTALSAASASSASTETSSDARPLTATRLRQKTLVASAKAKRAGSQRCSTGPKRKVTDEAPGSTKPAKKTRKVSVHTPVYHTRKGAGLPVVTPKFDIRKRPAATRPVRRGETLLSLSGSPVEAKTSAVPIHIHINKGQVVKVTASNNGDTAVQELYKAIKNLCGKI